MRIVLSRNLLLIPKSKLKKKYYRNLVRETNLANVAVLFVGSFSVHSGKIDYPIQIATIWLGLQVRIQRG